MKTAYIRGGEIADRAALHRALAEQLDFPAWYGNNLDALYDLLTATAEPWELVVENEAALRERLGGYYDLLWAMLRDVENPNVRVIRPDGESDMEAW